MKDYKLIINTNSKKYPIYIGYNILNSSKRIFKINNIKIKKCLIVVDKNVPKKNLSVLKKNIVSSKILFHSFNANEKNKSLEYVNSIFDTFTSSFILTIKLYILSITILLYYSMYFIFKFLIIDI